MNKLSRREFLKASIVVGASLLVVDTIPKTKLLDISTDYPNNFKFFGEDIVFSIYDMLGREIMRRPLLESEVTIREGKNEDDGIFKIDIGPFSWDCEVAISRVNLKLCLGDAIISTFYDSPQIVGERDTVTFLWEIMVT